MIPMPMLVKLEMEFLHRVEHKLHINTPAFQAWVDECNQVYDQSYYATCEFYYQQSPPLQPAMPLHNPYVYPAAAGAQYYYDPYATYDYYNDPAAANWSAARWWPAYHHPHHYQPWALSYPLM